MKLFKVILAGLVLFASSCSNDSDPKPSLEKQTVSFLESDPITPPSAMASSTDPHAQTASGWIAMTNIMSAYAAFFEAPAGTRSETKITASNGRTGIGRIEATGDYATYIWHDDASGWSVGYQISEKSDSYAFEIFIKTEPNAEWLKWIHAEEKKNRSQGSMKIYDITGSTDSPSTPILTYNWTRSGDVLTMTIDDFTDFFTAVVVINEKTKAGSLVYRINGQKMYEMTWDSKGNGSYTYYSSEGTVENEGTWTV